MATQVGSDPFSKSKMREAIPNRIINVPPDDTRWHGKPRKHSPSSSNSDSITNGGANAVTMRNTERARADNPAIQFTTPCLSLQNTVLFLWSDRNNTWYNDVSARPHNCVQSNTRAGHQTNMSPFGQNFAIVIAAACVSTTIECVNSIEIQMIGWIWCVDWLQWL